MILEIKRIVVAEVELFGIWQREILTQLGCKKNFMVVRVTYGIRPGIYSIESPDCDGSGFMQENF